VSAPLHGVLGEFERAHELVAAARAARDAGWTRLDAYSPFPVDELGDALRLRRSRLPLAVFAGGAIGCAAALWFQWWASASDFPQDVGGRPYASWPAFIPVAFEMTVLSASLVAILGMFGASGLPRPHHPLFAVERFDRASRDRFFLCLEAHDPRFDAAAARAFLATAGAAHVVEVPA
jgi:hypothetical protein